MGPSLSIPNSVYFPYTGQFLQSLGNTLTYIPVIPDMVLTLKFLYSDLPDEIIGDISSTIFNNALAFGYIIGPAGIFNK